MGKRQNKSLFKRSLIGFTLVLVILCELALFYVFNTLKRYEQGDVSIYMQTLTNDLSSAAKKEKMEKHLTFAKLESPYEKNTSLAKGYKELFENNKAKYEKGEKENEYIIYAGDVKVAKVTLDGSKKEKRLGLLNYPVWEVKSMEAFNEKGLYNYDIFLADNLKLYINDVEVKNSDLIDSVVLDEYKELEGKSIIPKINHYQIVNLTQKPKFKVLDENNKKIDLELKDGKYYADNYFHTDDEAQAMNKLSHDYDSLAFAKKWSLFLTNDLSGNKHGLYQLTPNLVEGTQMYQRAYNWATQVDITFTSNHTLAKETFTNTKVSNFTVYNENTFSVQVYLEKNMVVGGYLKQVDKLHDIFYYTYYDGAYRLVKMVSVS